MKHKSGPLLPRAMILSRATTYSQRASSSTSVLLSDGMAAKSNCRDSSPLENRASLIRRSTMRRTIDEFQFGKAQEKRA